MGKIAAISQGLGDVIFSLQVCKALNVTKLLINDVALEDGSTTFKALARLVQSQGIEPIPIKGLPFGKYPAGTEYDYDLNKAMRQPKRNKNHILLSFKNQFRQRYDIRQPWLDIGKREKRGYGLVCLTPRWRDNSNFDWKIILDNYLGDLYFIGFEQDYQHFRRFYGFIHWAQTVDLMDMALLIRDCGHLYCNQNPALAIVGGLGGIPYSCEFKPTKTNTMLYTPFENILK